jgi:hypothetical protein
VTTAAAIAGGALLALLAGLYVASRAGWLSE